MVWTAEKPPEQMTGISVVFLLTAFAGLAIVALAIGRMLDITALRSRRWPGPFKQGSDYQRRSVAGLVPMGLGVMLLGLGLLLGRPGGIITATLLVAAGISYVVAALIYAGIVRPRI